MTWNTLQEVDIAVVGGGLAGLTAAAHAAKSGRRVALFEGSAEPGGRAQTHDERGFLLNLGPHALYNGGGGIAVLRELGVTWTGGSPRAGAAAAYLRGEIHALPTGARSLLASDLFGVRDRLEYGRVMARLTSTDRSELAQVSLDEWLNGRVRRPRVRAVIDALFRVATYSNVPRHISAAAVLDQWAVATKGVTYLHGGWRQLVQGLRNAAESAGAAICPGAGVRSVRRGPAGFELTFDGGRVVRAASVVVALPVHAAADVILGPGRETFVAWARAAVPSYVSVYDVALSALPEPARPFAIGLDQPFYLSVHTTVARLAPEGQALVSLARYNDIDEDPDPTLVKAELGRMLDALQPGWRERLLFERFLPSMQVQSDVPRANAGGLAGRPGPSVPGVPGLFVAGDWVGPEGMLADAPLVSGREAGRLAAAAAALGTPAREPATIAR